MKRRIAAIAAWVAATFLTALVAWGAVNVAGDQVAEQPVRPLSASEIEALPGTPLTTVPPTTTIAATTTSSTTTKAALPVSSTTTTLPSGASGTTTTSTTRPATGTTAATTATTTSTTVPAPATTTTSPPAPDVTAHQLTGGKVVISASPGIVNLVSWTPKPGFSGEVEKSGPDEVRVRFESDTHESEFEAEWDDGELVISKDENDED